MDNNYQPNPKYKLIYAIIELICGVGLVGFSIYYNVIGEMGYFWLILAIGALIIFLACRLLYKLWKQKKNGDKK